MHEIDLLTGKRIRTFRKARGLTLEALAAQICKSKSTLSKYEKGEISLDLPTLYELSQALHIQPVQLLENLPQPDILSLSSPTPTFFGGSTQLYAYLFDGSATINYCVAFWIFYQKHIHSGYFSI